MKHKRIVFIILALVLLAAALGSCAPVSDTEEVQTSGLGLNWYRDIKEYNGWIYYTVQDEGLYKIRQDGKNKTLVIDKCPYSIEIYENRIYFALSKDSISEDNSIYSCKMNGKDIKFVCKKYFSSADKTVFYISDDWLYYIPKFYEKTLYKTKSDGSEEVQMNEIEEHIIDFSIDNDWIYYTALENPENSSGFYVSLYRISKDGITKKKLTTSECSAVDYNENYIFFVDKSSTGIYRENIDDGRKYKIEEFNSEGKYVPAAGLIFKVVGDWIYYIDDGLYKIRIDGSEKVKINDDYHLNSRFANICGNWLIYYDFQPEIMKIKMVRIGDVYSTGDIIAQILAEQYPDIEIVKYE